MIEYIEKETGDQKENNPNNKQIVIIVRGPFEFIKLRVLFLPINF
jgi:hypothetical protein